MYVFPFVAEGCVGGQDLRWLVLLRKPGYAPRSELESSLKRALEARLVFDAILIVALSSERAQWLLQQEDVIRLEERTRNAVPRILVVAVNDDGNVASYARTGFAPSTEMSDEEGNNLLRRVVHEGLEEVRRQSTTTMVERAPNGRPFEKTSGKFSNYFIRAETACDNSDSVYLLALAVLQRIARWKQTSTAVRLSQIFIDSMAVYPIAAAVAMLVKELRSTAQDKQALVEIPAIESFHSYDGYLNALPVSNASFCIISASSSGSLASSWVGAHGTGSMSTLVLFSFAQDSASAPVLVTLKQPVDFSEDPEVSGPTLRVVNEWFRMEQLPTKRVVIAKLRFNHAKQFLEIVHSNAFHVSSETRDTHSVDLHALRTQGSANGWLGEHFRQLKEGGVCEIVCPDDYACGSIRDCLVRHEIELPVRSVGDFFASPPQGHAKCAYVGLGASADTAMFFEWAQRIRSFLNIKPVFASVVTMFTTAKDSQRFKRTLNGICSAPGARCEPWFELVADLSPLRNYAERNQRLFGVLKFDSGIPIVPSVTAKLNAREDDSLFNVPLGVDRVPQPFVGWPGNWENEAISHDGIALTIAAALQNVRENEDIKWDERLRGALGEDAVLCPSNFLQRYNDPVLVAAFLRLGHDAELDYSHDTQCSEQISQRILKLLNQWDAVERTELVEYLIALAVGRLKLVRADITLITGNENMQKGRLAELRAMLLQK